MTERKETPDILGAILSGASADQPAPAQPVSSSGSPVAPPVAIRVERAPRAARPTKWEYLVVSFHEQNGWHARFVNGRELDTWLRGPHLHHVLDQLGEEGWELVNIVKSEPLYGTMDRLQAFFKWVKA